MKRIMYKIIVIAVTATLLTGLLVGLSLTYFIEDIFENQLKSTSEMLYGNFDRVASLEVETILSLLKKIDEMDKAGELGGMDAKELSRKIIRDLRYEEEGYFWIDTYDGTNVVLLGKPIEGKSRINLQDVKGKYLIKELLEKGKLGGGYTDYWFPRPGDTTAYPKRGFSKAYSPYEWVVGTGNYVDDIEMINKELQLKVESEKATIRNYSLIILVVVVVMMTIFSIIMGKRISNPIVQLTQASVSLSKGVMIDDIQIKSKDELKNLSEAFNQMKAKISDVIAETKVLSQAAKDGKLDYRAKSSNFEGSYKEIIVGINEAIDNLIAPLNVTAEYVDRISKGDIPPKITEDYRGDFNEIKNNVNLCIDSINYLILDTKSLINSATIGKLTDRADAQKHLGEFRNIINGINQTFDRLVGLIDNMPLPVQILDNNYKVLYINKEAERITKV